MRIIDRSSLSSRHDADDYLRIQNMFEEETMGEGSTERAGYGIEDTAAGIAEASGEGT
jgi:hypothetical protein